MHEGPVRSLRIGCYENMGPTDDQFYPGAMIPVVEIRMQRTGKVSNLTVGTAQVNPALEEVQKWVKLLTKTDCAMFCCR